VLAELLAALAPARSLRTKSGALILQLLSMDYCGAGFVQNHSIAGAGYLTCANHTDPGCNAPIC
jgi:hypothetical protein